MEYSSKTEKSRTDLMFMLSLNETISWLCQIVFFGMVMFCGKRMVMC